MSDLTARIKVLTEEIRAKKAERDTLKKLRGVTASFTDQVEQLNAIPEDDVVGYQAWRKLALETLRDAIIAEIPVEPDPE